MGVICPTNSSLVDMCRILNLQCLLSVSTVHRHIHCVFEISLVWYQRQGFKDVAVIIACSADEVVLILNVESKC